MIRARAGRCSIRSRESRLNPQKKSCGQAQSGTRVAVEGRLGVGAGEQVSKRVEKDHQVENGFPGTFDDVQTDFSRFEVDVRVEDFGYEVHRRGLERILVLDADDDFEAVVCVEGAFGAADEAAEFFEIGLGHFEELVEI